MKRYQVIPLVLAIYAIIMAVLGRENFINPATRLTSILRDIQLMAMRKGTAKV